MSDGECSTYIPIDFPEKFPVSVIALGQRVCRDENLPPFIVPIVTHLRAKQRFPKMRALSFSGIVGLNRYRRCEAGELPAPVFQR